MEDSDDDHFPEFTLDDQTLAFLVQEESKFIQNTQTADTGLPPKQHHHDPFSRMDPSTPWKSCQTYLFKWMEHMHCKLGRDSLPSKPANPKWFAPQVLLRIHSCNEDPTYPLLGPEGNPLFMHVLLQLLQEGFRYLRAHQLQHAWYKLLPHFHHRIWPDLSSGLCHV